MLLDLFGIFALFLELSEDGGLGMALGNPTGEGVCEEDSGAVLVGKGSARAFQKRRDLEVGDDEGRGHDLKAEDAGEGSSAEGAGDKGGVVAGCFKQGPVDAMEDGGEIGARPAAGVEDADSGTGQAEGLIELGAEKMVDALDHVFDDLLGRVPYAKVFAELGIEGLKKGLVEVGNGLVFAECVEEGWLDAVERFSS